MSPPSNIAIQRDWTGFILPALAVFAFSLFLHQIKWLGIGMLALALLLVFARLIRIPYDGLLQLFGFRNCRWHWILTGAALGTGLAMLLRWDQGRLLYPAPMRGFVWMAILIGITEELVFRGYFLGLFIQDGIVLSASFAALLHTAYKLLIFVPYADLVDFVFLGALTLAVGAFAGWSRKMLGSIWPCVACHALFDVWVYGDRLTPFWVW